MLRSDLDNQHGTPNCALAAPRDGEGAALPSYACRRPAIVSAAPYGEGMSHSSGPQGQVTPALARLNEEIRRLMQQPASKRRTHRYEQLLRLWGDATRGDDAEAA